MDYSIVFDWNLTSLHVIWFIVIAFMVAQAEVIFRRIWHNLLSGIVVDLTVISLYLEEITK